MQSPRLLPGSAKIQFLEDYPKWAKVLGVAGTVEHLLPCLVECFNSDEVIHPDIYDQHATLLFGQMPQLIEFLGKNVKLNQDQEDTKSEASSTSSIAHAAAQRENLNSFSHDLAFEDPLARGSGPKSAYHGLLHIILKEIYELYF